MGKTNISRTFTYDLLNITCGSNISIIERDVGICYKSIDGINWVQIDNNNLDTINKISYNGKCFVAICSLKMIHGMSKNQLTELVGKQYLVLIRTLF